MTTRAAAVAAAAAAGKLLGLDAALLVRALGIAATQAAGLQRNRGTASKPLNAGKAAANGLLAALRAERGFDCAPDGIEGRLGFGEVYGGLTAPEAITRALGSSWAIMRNGYKPYPCGLVSIIDGVLALRSRVSRAGVASIELRCHPIVARIGQGAAAGMSKHVRMDQKGEAGALADVLDEAIDCVRRERPAALGGEDEGRIRGISIRRAAAQRWRKPFSVRSAPNLAAARLRHIAGTAWSS